MLNDVRFMQWCETLLNEVRVSVLTKMYVTHKIIINLEGGTSAPPLVVVTNIPTWNRFFTLTRCLQLGTLQTGYFLFTTGSPPGSTTHLLFLPVEG
jgi:hypothetical protein